MNAVSLLRDFSAGARILILRLRSIGDIILLTPALRLLKEWRPDLRISVMVESRFRDLLQGTRRLKKSLFLAKGLGRATCSRAWRSFEDFAAADFLFA